MDDLVISKKIYRTSPSPRPVLNKEVEQQCGCNAWLVYMKIIECINATVFMFKSMTVQLLVLEHLVLLLALQIHM